MAEQKLYGTFIKTEPIEKGWSEDKKYCVTSEDGTQYLLRVTSISRYETRKSLFAMLEKVATLDVPMCTPVEFGTCEDGVYNIQSWINGEDLETVLPMLSETEQYIMGLKSGEIARKMHSIPAPETQEEWESRFNRKTDYKIQKYHECGLRFDGDEHVLAYIEQNRHLLKNRPQCFQHGDYHVGNMMVENGELKIIDFDRYDFGDPWEEFNRIVWSAAASPHFATGQLRGYFDGEPPMEFFKLLAFYIASNTLSSIYWAVPFGQSDLDTMMKQAQDILRWYDSMRNPVPTWYLSKYELWNILDINGNKTGRVIERGQPMYDDEYHLSVHVWIHNQKGEWLISKRSPEKKSSPNIWEACGGAALAGEDSLTTALRETKEELGLTLAPDKGRLITTIIHENRHPPGGSCMADVWIFSHDCPIEDIILQPGETCDARWENADAIRSMMASGDFLNVINFDEMVEKWRAAKA